jgi:hypothetical protein
VCCFEWDILSVLCCFGWDILNVLDKIYWVLCVVLDETCWIFCDNSGMSTFFSVSSCLCVCIYLSCSLYRGCDNSGMSTFFSVSSCLCVCLPEPFYLPGVVIILECQHSDLSCIVSVKGDLFLHLCHNLQEQIIMC